MRAAKRVELAQGTRPWFRWRDRGVGGSDVALIMGLSPYGDRTADDLLNEKVHGSEHAGPDENFAMRRGRMLEPVAREAFEAEEGVSFPPACFESADRPWMHASLDGYSADGVVLEIKCPKWQDHDLVLAGVVPEHFAVQVQWQLCVTGSTLAELVSYNPSKRFEGGAELAAVQVRADIERQREIYVACSRFWRRVTDAVGKVA